MKLKSLIPEIKKRIDFKSMFVERDRLKKVIDQVESKYYTFNNSIGPKQNKIRTEFIKLDSDMDDIRRDLEMDPEVKASEGHSGTRGGYYGDLMNVVDTKEDKLRDKLKAINDQDDKNWDDVDKAWATYEAYKKKIKKAFP